MLQGGGFNFAWFDAVATNLYLVIDAADVIQIPVRHPTAQITRAIETSTGIGG